MSLTHTEPNPHHPRFPKLFYLTTIPEGLRSVGGPTLRGTVSLEADGETVHWTSVASFEGHEAYESTGIQVGGIRSAFGVVGLWSALGHEAGSPAGPF